MPAANTSLRIVTVGASRRAEYRSRIAQLEQDASYPLGTDRFRIDHGDDYFAFFDRLGKASFEVCLDGDDVVAVVARVLRAQPRRCWYLCDLKVRPSHRGRRISARFVRHAFLPSYARCGRGYAISMNDDGPGQNRVERLVERLRMVRFRSSNLSLFQLDADAIEDARGKIERSRGALSFVSLAGIKDIVLESTGAPLPLLHAQFGPCATGPGIRSAQPGATHMLCTPSGDALDLGLRALGHLPSASATVLHHRMGDRPFDHVLTSEI